MPADPMGNSRIPRNENSEMLTMARNSFQVVHLLYDIYSQKTIKKGRRIGIEKAVETPAFLEMLQALQALQDCRVLQPHALYIQFRYHL